MEPSKGFSFDRFCGEFVIASLVSPIFLGIYYGVLEDFNFEVITNGINFIIFPGIIIVPFAFIIHFIVILLKIQYNISIFISIFSALYLLSQEQYKKCGAGEIYCVFYDYINIYMIFIFLINSIFSYYLFKK